MCETAAVFSLYSNPWLCVWAQVYTCQGCSRCSCGLSVLFTLECMWTLQQCLFFFLSNSICSENVKRFTSAGSNPGIKCSYTTRVVFFLNPLFSSRKKQLFFFPYKVFQMQQQSLKIWFTKDITMLRGSSNDWNRCAINYVSNISWDISAKNTRKQ